MGLGMMIGAGVFLGIGNAVYHSGPGGVVLTFSLNGLIALFTAMSYAELSSAIPKAGGAMHFARMGFGNGPGFIAGWMEWFAGNGNDARAAALGQAVFGVAEALPAGEAASETVISFSRWLKKINCPVALHDLSISSGDHRRIAENAMVQAEIWGINKIYTSDRVVEILERCQERSV